MKELRPYQQQAIDAIHANLAKGITRQALILPTGCGKTLTCVRAIKGMGRILFIAHTEELLEQSAIALLAELELMPYELLIDIIGNCGGLIELLKTNKSDSFFLDANVKVIIDNIGLIKADQFIIDKPIVVASAQTLHKRIDRIASNYFDVVVADECDLFGSVSFNKSLSHFTPKLRLGLTATFYRMDNMPLYEIFDEVAFEYPVDQAVSEGYLTKPEAIQLKTSTDLDAVHTSGGDFKVGELVEKVNTPVRNNQIVNAYLEYGEGRQFIAFCVDVEHTQDLCEAFKEKGISCEFVVGDKELTTDRRGTIQKFKEGEIAGLTNCMVLSVGFDYSDIGVAIMACPTKSKRKFIQQVGRALRLKTPKFVDRWGQKAIIIDVVDNTSKHKLINTKELDKDLPLEKKVFISEKNRQLLLDVKFKRESTFTSAQRLTDIKVDLLQLPKVEISGSMRMQEPATEKMLNWIASWGYDIVNVHYTKYMCSEIIASQSASDKQIWVLQKHGYDVSNGVTITEARLAFREIKEKEERQKMDSMTKDINLSFKF